MKRIFHSSGRSVIRAINLLFLVGALAFAKSQVLPADDFIHATGTFLIALGLVAIVAVISELANADIVAEPDGLTKRALGASLAHVQWDEVTSIRCQDISYRGYRVRLYRLYVKERDRCAELTFRGDLEDAPELIEIIRLEVERREIPIMIRKMGWPIGSHDLPMPDEQLGSMW